MRYFIHRHDIDTDVGTARRMFEAERKLGVVSSAYFRLSTERPLFDFRQSHRFARRLRADDLDRHSLPERGEASVRAVALRHMAETAAHLVDHVIPRVPVRQWVLAFPIPLRWPFAAHPHLLSSVLQIVHRVLSTFVIQQMGFQRTEAKTGAVTLIQRFGSAANLNVHLHCLLLDGV